MFRLKQWLQVRARRVCKELSRIVAFLHALYALYWQLPMINGSVCVLNSMWTLQQWVFGTLPGLVM